MNKSHELRNRLIDFAIDVITLTGAESYLKIFVSSVKTPQENNKQYIINNK